LASSATVAVVNDVAQPAALGAIRVWRVSDHEGHSPSQDLAPLQSETSSLGGFRPTDKNSIRLYLHLVHSGPAGEIRTLAGLKISPLRMAELLDAVRLSIVARDRLTITYLNPDYARKAFKSKRLREDINRFDIVLVDGNGIRIVTPLFGFVVPERLDADSVAPQVFEMLGRLGARVYLFGCGPGVADTAADKILDAYPGLAVAGTEHGYHDVLRGHPLHIDDEDSARIVEKINTSGADILLVSLPTPLQQAWVSTYGPSLDVPIVMAAGSYLDHVADSQALRWYPRWADSFRLNWFYRLRCEPKRLWRRYSIEFLQYLVMVIAFRLRLAQPSNDLEQPPQERTFTARDERIIDIRTPTERAADRANRRAASGVRLTERERA
jgi:N-acetylglucosaminyldiphosphoundecaprenol N-acetyl-beta-D-mannosaminyltransferase